jgi:asparagine synthase (glutamine-hydrolysing)
MTPEWLVSLGRQCRVGAVSGNPDWLNVDQMGIVPENPFLGLGGKAGSIRELSLSQLQWTNLPMLLHWEDRNSMAHSVEARVPFLDYRLVEYALALPDSYKIGGGVTKLILREAMRGVVPDAIRTRMDKKAFALPEGVWAAGPASDEFGLRLSDAVEGSDGLFTRRLLERFEQVRSGQVGYEQYFWRVISCNTWLRRFSVA